MHGFSVISGPSVSHIALDEYIIMLNLRLHQNLNSFENVLTWQARLLHHAPTELGVNGVQNRVK